MNSAAGSREPNSQGVRLIGVYCAQIARNLEVRAVLGQGPLLRLSAPMPVAGGFGLLSSRVASWLPEPQTLFTVLTPVKERKTIERKEEEAGPAGHLCPLLWEEKPVPEASAADPPLGLLARTGPSASYHVRDSKQSGARAPWAALAKHPTTPGLSSPNSRMVPWAREKREWIWGNAYIIMASEKNKMYP